MGYYYHNTGWVGEHVNSRTRWCRIFKFVPQVHLAGAWGEAPAAASIFICVRSVMGTGVRWTECGSRCRTQQIVVTQNHSFILTLTKGQKKQKTQTKLSRLKLTWGYTGRQRVTHHEGGSEWKHLEEHSWIESNWWDGGCKTWRGWDEGLSR